jgi:hypothetical protein
MFCVALLFSPDRRTIPQMDKLQGTYRSNFCNRRGLQVHILTVGNEVWESDRPPALWGHSQGFLLYVGPRILAAIALCGSLRAPHFLCVSRFVNYSLRNRYEFTLNMWWIPFVSSLTDIIWTFNKMLVFTRGIQGITLPYDVRFHLFFGLRMSLLSRALQFQACVGLLSSIVSRWLINWLLVNTLLFKLNVYIFYRASG